VTDDEASTEIEAVVVDTDMDVDEAQAITERICAGLQDTWELIKRAYIGRAWVALEYGSWDEYCIGEFGDARLRIPREERPELVCSLRQAGMSIRAIASATGAGYGTVRRDLSGEPFGSPVDADAEDDAEVISERTHEAVTALRESIANERYPVSQKLRDRADWWARASAGAGEAVPITIVTGRDGKRYPPRPERPQPKPRRRPTPDRRGATRYSKEIQKLSASIAESCTTMTNEEISEALGAAQFLYELLRGETILRERSIEAIDPAVGS
jgi:hypothetical protein